MLSALCGRRVCRDASGAEVRRLWSLSGLPLSVILQTQTQTTPQQPSGGLTSLLLIVGFVIIVAMVILVSVGEGLRKRFQERVEKTLLNPTNQCVHCGSNLTRAERNLDSGEHLSECPNCGMFPYQISEHIQSEKIASILTGGNVECAHCGYDKLDEGDTFCSRCNRRPHGVVRSALGDVNKMTCTHCESTIEPPDERLPRCPKCGNNPYPKQQA